MGSGGSTYAPPSSNTNTGLPIIYKAPIGGGPWIKLQPGSYDKMSELPKSAVPEQQGVGQGTGGPTTYNFNGVGSMNIPAGVTVQLYSAPYFNGTMWTYVGPLVASYVGDATYNNPNNAANFSIKVLGGPLTGLTGTQVSGTLKQTTPYLQYQNGDCQCCSSNDGCPNGDWVISHTSCGKCCVQTQPVCSVLDSALCPTIGQGASSITWAVPNGISNEPSALVKCSYDLAEFKTGTDIENFLNGNPLNPWQDPSNVNNEYNNVVMPYFCGQQVSTCPVDPSTGQSMPKCSRFVSTAPDGSAAACTEWITKGLSGQSGFDSSSADGTMANYCTKYNTPDCNCVNRANDPVYKLISPTQKGNDGCWFAPCKDPKTYLIPSTANATTVYSKQPCPSSCTVNIQNIATDFSVVSIGQIESKVACSFVNPPAPTPTPTPTPAPTPAPSSPTSPGAPGAPPVSPVTPAKKGISPLIWIAVAVGIILLIIIVIVIVVLVSRKKPPATV